MSPSLANASELAVKSGRCVVHIGLNKTGTTTVQTWLEQNRDRLRDRGVHTPEVRSSKVDFPVLLHFLGILPFQLTNHLAPRGRIRRRLNLTTLQDQKEFCDACIAQFDSQLADQTAEQNTTILSSEMLGGWVKTQDQIRALDEWLHARFDRVDYLVYLRNPADWILSRFTQNVKHGAAVSLDSFIERNRHAKLFGLLNLWSDTLGADRVQIRLFQRDELVNNDIVDDFCAAVDIDATGTAPAISENVAPSARELRAILVRNRLRKALRLQRRESGTRFSWLANGTKLTLTADQSARINSINAEDLEKIRIKYFPERTTVFADPLNSHIARKQD